MRIGGIKQFDITGYQLDGGFVIRNGKLFEVGDYPDKQFALTEAEADAAVSAFAPSPLNIEHGPTIFDGKLGEVRKLWRKDGDLMAEYAIPKWLHEVTGGGDPIKISSEWDRETKRIVGAALVLNPRVADAAIMAAFSETFKDRGAMQRLHDMSADCGAECGGQAYFDAASFMTPDELKAIQHVHDHCAKNGADCDAYATRKEMWFSKNPAAGSPGRKDKPMTIWEKIKAAFSDAGIDTDAEIPKVKDSPALAATVVGMSAEDKAKFDAQAKELSDLKGLVATMAQTQQVSLAQSQTNEAERRVQSALKAFKIFPSQRAPHLLELAKTNFAEFSIRMDEIEKGRPNLSLGGYSPDTALAVGGIVDETSDFSKEVKKRADEKKISFSDAAYEITQERPELARAVYENRSVMTAEG